MKLTPHLHQLPKYEYHVNFFSLLANLHDAALLTGCQYWDHIVIGWFGMWSSWWNENWQGKLFSEKICPSATLSTTNPWCDLGLNLCCHSDKLAINYLNCAMAFMAWFLYIMAIIHFYICYRCKLVCTVEIGEKCSQSVCSVLGLLWDADHDNYASYTYENTHVYAVACVYGVYYEWNFILIQQLTNHFNLHLSINVSIHFLHKIICITFTY
jgi:hypothetical protein